MTSTRAWFSAIATAEGLSLLILFGVAMPLKYAAGRPEAVAWVGWVHGMLFLVYFVALGSIARVEGWGWGRVAVAAAASMIPFAPFFVRK